jgi:hypothetical protein
MKDSAHFFDCNPAVMSQTGALHRFNVKCIKCGSLRVILIAELNNESGEFTIVHSIGSRKTYCCEFPSPKLETAAAVD